MPATVPMRLDLDVPVAFVEALVKQHLRTLFAANGHAATNGHAPVPAPPPEEPAPVPVPLAAVQAPASTGAP